MDHNKAYDIDKLQQAWENLLPEGAMTRTLVIADYTDRLAEAELHYIAGVSERRKTEFSTSRYAIRSLIQSQCDTWQGVIPDSQHMPVWPEGWRGSISHSRGICTVTVAQKTRVSAIGIDLESLDRLRPELWHKIATRDELEQIERYCSKSSYGMADLMTAVFSLKEAFYKYQYPLTGLWLGFLDVHLSFTSDNSAVLSRQAEVGDLPVQGTTIAYQLTPTHVLSTVYRLHT